MHPPYSALTVILFGLSGFLLIGAAGYWLKLSRGREAVNERPAIPVHRFRAAAGYTGIAMGLLGISLLWFALVALNG
jgi:hypothetical protein